MLSVFEVTGSCEDFGLCIHKNAHTGSLLPC